METGYIVVTVNENHLKALRRSIYKLYCKNQLSISHNDALSLCNQLDRHYEKYSLLFFNQFEYESIWKIHYKQSLESGYIQEDTKKALSEINTQLESFYPIQLESEIFDLNKNRKIQKK
jgi:DNA polymerase III sliding clamp (beta) subunit (PCNA family)